MQSSELAAYLDAGDLRGAGTWLVERHAHEVIGLCRAMVHDRHTAEDLAQEVFGRAFAGLGSFRGEASPRSWLLAIARNRCIDHLRARQRDPWRGAPPDDGRDPDRHPDERPLAPDLLDRRDEVASALRQLSEGERALVVLRFRHGMEYHELAEVFGLKPGTVRMRMSRALSRMRRALQPTMLEAAAVRSLASVDGLVSRSGEADAESAEPPPRRARAGLLGRVLKRRRPETPPETPPEAPPAPAPHEHPLVAVLGLLDPGVPEELRARLAELAQKL